MRALILAALCVAAPCAQATTGQDFLGWMDSRDEADKIGALLYVRGYADGSVNHTHCVPKSVTALQLTAMTTKFLRAHPEVWDVHVGHVVERVLRDNWPCGKRGTGRATL